MLDLFLVVTEGGLIEFEWKSSARVENPINECIGLLLSSQTKGNTIAIKNQEINFLKTKGRLLLTVHQSIIHLNYLHDLLLSLSHSLNETGILESVFLNTLNSFEKEDLIEKKQKLLPRDFKDTKKHKDIVASKMQKVEDTPEPQLTPKQKKLKELRDLKMKRQNSGNSESDKGSPNIEEKKKGKAKRVWGDSANVSVEVLKSLDHSEQSSANAYDTSEVDTSNLVDRSDLGDIVNGIYDVPEMESRYDDLPDRKQKKQSTTLDENSNNTGIFSYFQSLTTGRLLKSSDLDPVLENLQNHLVEKNVAVDIARVLCESVKQGLEGKKISAFTRINQVVSEQMEIAIRRILTPSSSIDVLRDVLVAKADGRPYSFVFVGVNGVGKSTNLSKVCFWLLQQPKHKLRVLIAACDTFRAGAVEQLKVHIRNLSSLVKELGGGEVELFERGYGKDAAGIAKDALAFAKKNKFDVVLIDTAGRMQDNEPLMRALAKLVAVNNPDKVVFVGEALAGNESVDQLSKFNRALKDFSGQENPRQIDGMILTKFDTVDDKVGSALSMTYVTGKPVLFVGTGQTYSDLKKMNIPSIVATLLDQ